MKSSRIHLVCGELKPEIERQRKERERERGKDREIEVTINSDSDPTHHLDVDDQWACNMI